MHEEEAAPMFGNLLRAPAEALNKRILAALADAGFTDLRPAHPTVFQHLPSTGARATTLAERAQMTKQSMGELVDYLVRAGYLERGADPSDGRATIIRRTARGWEVERLARATIAAVESEWGAALGVERLLACQQFLADLGVLLAEPTAAPVTQ